MKYLVALLFLCLTLYGYAADRSVPPVKKEQVRYHAARSKAVLKADSTAVKVREFNAKALSDYRGQKEFIYDDAAPPLHESLWSRFWRYIWRILGLIFNNSISGSVIKYMLLALIIGGTVFVLLKVIGLDLKIFKGKSKALEVPYRESIENLHEINFDEEIEQAIDQAHYRQAVRLLYLRTLKILNDQNVIHWQPEKTNQTYIEEIEEVQKKAQFTVLTHQFEYIWYGDFAIDKNNFGQIRAIFQQFNLKRS